MVPSLSFQNKFGIKKIKLVTIDYTYLFKYIGSNLEDACHPSKEVFFQFGVDETVTTPRISLGGLKWKPFGINKKEKEKIHCLKRNSGDLLEILLNVQFQVPRLYTVAV